VVEVSGVDGVPLVAGLRVLVLRRVVPFMGCVQRLVSVGFIQGIR
jgi:hypothetical protein